MPSFANVLARAGDKEAFSNGTEWEAWQYGWCLRPGAFCRNDDIDRGGGRSCPLIDVALLELKTPAEWGEQASALGPEMYTCTMYEAE